MSINRPKKQATLSDLIDDFTKAIQSNPKDASAFFNRGMVYHEQGKYDEAMDDYKKAVKLEPQLKAKIESHVAHKLKRGNDLKKMPTGLVEKVSSFLDLRDLARLPSTDRSHHKLFKPKIALKKLLALVVNYEVKSVKKILVAQAAGVNPILHEVNALLTQDPTLALKRDHITDLSGRKHYWSPLEAAHWSGNWMLRDMIFKHAQSIPAKTNQASGEMRAAEQLREWDQQAYNYDLMLMRATGDTFPLLKKDKPALIKQYSEQGEDKIFQWGDVNGEWQLTELDSDTKKLFAHLNFPVSSSKPPITTPSDQITTGMYDALKKGHTPAHFDLDEYVRVTDAFLKKYPANVPVPPAQWYECNTDSSKIGHAQKKFPAWLAAIWCSTIPFYPLLDVKQLIASLEVFSFKLFYGEDFFDARLGKDFLIYKGGGGSRGRRAAGVYYGNLSIVAADLAVMAALCKVINEELGKAKQLLPEESKSTPGLS